MLADLNVCMFYGYHRGCISSDFSLSNCVLLADLDIGLINRRSCIWICSSHWSG